MNVEAGVATLGAAQAITLFAAFAPKPNEVRKHSLADVEYANDVRRAEGIAGVISVSFGAYVSLHTKNLAPLVLSGVAVLGLVWLYEYQLRTPPGRAMATPALAFVNSHSEYTPVPLYAIEQEAN